MRFLEWIERGDSEDPAEHPRVPDLPPAAGPAPTWKALLALARRRLERPASPLTPAAADALFQWNVERGANPGLQASWSALQEGSGLAVVTGQQPGLLGGPLYSLYKLLTAAALARRLERDTGRPALAIFWVVGDDSDFGEVAASWWPRPDGRVVKVRDTAQPPSGTLIGTLPAERQKQLLIEIDAGDPAREPAAVAGARGADSARALVFEALEAGMTWSGVQAALFFRLAPDLPFLVVDGAHPAVLQAQSGWLERSRGWPLAEWLRSGAAEARSAGFDPPLDPALGDRSVYRIEENRRVPWDGSRGAGDVLLAPNVVLRPLVQDLLLPNVATICGPSEIRYRAQLGPVYRGAEIPEPARIPRLRGILVPPVDPGDPGGVPPAFYREAALDPEGFLERRIEAARPREILEPVDRIRRETRARLEEIRPSLAGFDTSLGQLLDSVTGKVDFQIGRVREGIEAKARHRFLARNPHLASWREFLRPRDGEQERFLSLLTPYLSEGPESSLVLSEAAGDHLARILEKGLRPAGALCLLERYGGVSREGGDG